MEDRKLNEYEKNFIEYIESFKSRRKKLYDKVTIASINEKSETKKFCSLIGREIYEDNYNESVLFNGDLKANMMELIDEGIKNNMDLNEFISKLCNLSPIIDFIYHFSELYCHLFYSENISKIYDFFVVFMFKKNMKKIMILLINLEKYAIYLY